MKRSATAVLFIVLLAGPACRRGGNQNAETYPTSFKDGGVSAQNRIDQYFQQSALSKLKGCWSQVQGQGQDQAQGAVALDLSYRKSSETWMFAKASVKKSTLTDAQNGAAQKCAQESLDGTSFRVDRDERLEGGAEEFIVRLSLPVPLPAEGSTVTPQAMARMIGGAGESADIPGCSECVRNTDYPYGLKCEAKESGGHLDCREHSSNVCSTAPTACLRSFFSGSKVVMY